MPLVPSHFVEQRVLLRILSNFFVMLQCKEVGCRFIAPLIDLDGYRDPRIVSYFSRRYEPDLNASIDNKPAVNDSEQRAHLIIFDSLQLIKLSIRNALVSSLPHPRVCGLSTLLCCIY